MNGILLGLYLAFLFIGSLLLWEWLEKKDAEKRDGVADNAVNRKGG